MRAADVHPAAMHLLRRLLELWELQAAGDPNHVAQIRRGRAEIRRQVRTVLIDCSDYTTWCGRPTNKPGHPPCQNVKTSWPDNGAIELWACYTHLGADAQQVIQELKADLHAPDAHRRPWPLPADWEPYVRYRTPTTLDGAPRADDSGHPVQRTSDSQAPAPSAPDQRSRSSRNHRFLKILRRRS